MCMYDDCDFPTFYSKVDRKARKQHQCDECGRIISPGEQYQYVTAKWDGDINSVKTCTHCQVVQAWLQKECGGFVHHALIDDIEEHITEYGVRHYGFEVSRLVVMARNQWQRAGRLARIPAVPAFTSGEPF